MSRKWGLVVVALMLVIASFLLAGCAPGDGQFVVKPAGFLAGIWHGLISLVTLIISIFTDRVHMYEVNNTGWWYDFGFLIGLGLAGGGGLAGGRRGRRRR